MQAASPGREANTKLIDCHSHLDSFSDEEIEQILIRAQDAGVGTVITAGTTPETSARAVQLAMAFPSMYAGVGVHPMDLTGPIDEHAYRTLHSLVTSTNRVVTISEIGLDFLEGMPDRAVQYQAFREQIRLAREMELPIVFHSREAHAETLKVLREERAYEVGGAMHYFQGDLETARQAIDLGFYISLARPLLRLPELQEVAAQLPLESIVIETDTAPQPFKSKRESWTEPRHCRAVAEKLSKLQLVPIEQIEESTTQNALAMFSTLQGIRGAPQ